MKEIEVKTSLRTQDSSSQALISIVLLNWNGVKLLKKFLPTLIKYTPNSPIYVVDNHSSDASVKWLKNNYPQIKLVLLDKNYGFAKGYNQGLKQIHSTYYLLLNSDVEVTESWLEPILERLKKEDKVKIVQPKIKSYYNKSKFEYAGAAGGFIDVLCYPFCRGRIFNSTEEDKGQYDNSTEIFWASGAAFGIEAQLFHKLNGFDEMFFAHMEEIDLCWQAKNMGYKVIYEPRSTVYHIGGGTLSTTDPFKTFLNVRNSLMMILKNCPSPLCYFILLARLFLDGAIGIKFIFEGKFHFLKIILKSHFDFYKKITKVFKKRKAQNTKHLPPQIIRTSIILQHFIMKRGFQEIKKRFG